MTTKKRRLMQMSLFIIAGTFILAGILREEETTVLIKAINICLECIGIG